MSQLESVIADLTVGDLARIARTSVAEIVVHALAGSSRSASTKAPGRGSAVDATTRAAGEITVRLAPDGFGGACGTER